MADKKAPPAEEKIFTIPLRKEYLLATRVQRTKKTVSGVKKYILRHTRASDVRISQKLNDVLWAGGAKKPLKGVTVKVSVSEGIASARLPEEITLEEEKKKFLAEKKGEKKEAPEGEEKKPEEKAKAPEAEERPAGKTEEAPKAGEKG